MEDTDLYIYVRGVLKTSSHITSYSAASSIIYYRYTVLLVWAEWQTSDSHTAFMTLYTWKDTDMSFPHGYLDAAICIFASNLLNAFFVSVIYCCWFEFCHQIPFLQHLIISFHLQALFSTVMVSNSEDIARIDLLVDTKEAFHLYMSPIMMSDNGEYRCLYKTR